MSGKKSWGVLRFWPLREARKSRNRFFPSWLEIKKRKSAETRTTLMPEILRNFTFLYFLSWGTLLYLRLLLNYKIYAIWLARTITIFPVLCSWSQYCTLWHKKQHSICVTQKNRNLLINWSIKIIFYLIK